MTEKIKENVQDAADKVAKVCSITGNLQCSQTAQSGVALCAQTRVCAPALPSLLQPHRFRLRPSIYTGLLSTVQPSIRSFM